MVSVMSHTIVVAGVTDVSVSEVAALEEREDQAGGELGTVQRTLGLSYGDRQYRAPGDTLLGAAVGDEGRE
ncbi:hypothetical protein MAPG_09992 [Magnaporthiopsis poae ATCC 64411]|uniref:Uncharacterized protein n=1 Tax=Magnaporthiopsis poae (strain ATCC 64411 / 73-15) TaxID=644358 RepID=A0A0C4EBE5_MAGP6|nr:hypothetical protein MAPG_09992 [Magnaporthiopsis poae ATCC 64411]